MNPTFAYVYDERLTEPKFQRDIARLEADLAGFGIGGRIARLSLFRNARDTVQDFQRDGIRHVIVVGDDDTLLRMMWFLPDLQMAVGFVPLLGSKLVAPFLGIKNTKAAVQALAGRLTMSFDVGKVGDKCFLTKVVIPDTRAEVEIDGKFRLRPMEGGTITIDNVGGTSANDGVLDVSVSVGPPVKRFFWSQPQETVQTRLPMTVGQVHSAEPVTLIVDGQSLQGTSFKIGIMPAKVRFLVGKGRKPL